MDVYLLLLQPGVVLIPFLAPVVSEFLLPTEDEDKIFYEEVPRRRTPIEFNTAIPSDAILLLSVPSF